MPTYKEALKKLSKRKQRSRTPRRKSKVSGKGSRRLKKSVKKVKPKRRVIKKRKPATAKSPASTQRGEQKRQNRKKVSAALRRSRRKATKFHASAVARKVLRKKKPVKRKKPVKKRKPVKKKKIIKKKRAARRKARRKKVSRPRIYIGKGTLDQLFESQAKVKLLKFFFRSPGQIFQPKEIFKRLRSNVALLRQEMRKLEKLGLIKQKRVWLTFEKKRGGIKKEKKLVWYLNPNFDFFSELRNLVLKSAITSKNELVEKAKKTGNIKLLVLTGVFTGDETARADLLIVGDKINQRKLSNFIKDLESEVGKEINCAVMTSKEFDYRYDMYDRFVRDLLESKCDILLKKLELW